MCVAGGRGGVSLWHVGQALDMLGVTLLNSGRHKEAKTLLTPFKGNEIRACATEYYCILFLRPPALRLLAMAHCNRAGLLGYVHCEAWWAPLEFPPKVAAGE